MHNVEDVTRLLPYGRRFARALTGDRAQGDALVAASLRQGLPGLPTRLAIYAGIASATHGRQGDPHLTFQERCLLLLVHLEQLSLEEAAEVLGMDIAAAEAAASRAQRTIRNAATTDILVIEDEPVIALDIRMLVERCGHRVVGIASSEATALSLAAMHKPGLILADINLGIGGDGLAAVRRILAQMSAPVIFITAYPERLLTASGPEPAFVMTKPFDGMALAIATYQAIAAGHPSIL